MSTGRGSEGCVDAVLASPQLAGFLGPRMPALLAVFMRYAKLSPPLPLAPSLASVVRATSPHSHSPASSLAFVGVEDSGRSSARSAPGGASARNVSLHRPGGQGAAATRASARSLLLVAATAAAGRKGRNSDDQVISNSARNRRAAAPPATASPVAATRRHSTAGAVQPLPSASGATPAPPRSNSSAPEARTSPSHHALGHAQLPPLPLLRRGPALVPLPASHAGASLPGDSYAAASAGNIAPAQPLMWQHTRDTLHAPASPAVRLVALVRAAEPLRCEPGSFLARVRAWGGA